MLACKVIRIPPRQASSPAWRISENSVPPWCFMRVLVRLATGDLPWLRMMICHTLVPLQNMRSSRLLWMRGLQESGKAVPVRNWELTSSGSSSRMTVCMQRRGGGGRKTTHHTYPTKKRLAFAWYWGSVIWSLLDNILYWCCKLARKETNCLAEVTVLEHTLPARISMNCSVEPHRLDIEVIPEGSHLPTLAAHWPFSNFRCSNCIWNFCNAPPA